MTQDKAEIGAVVCVHERGMKENCSSPRASRPPASIIVKLYGKRFTIEETFRDTKDLRFGMGLKNNPHLQHRTEGPHPPRERLAMALLTLAGRCLEKVGLDKLLRAKRLDETNPFALLPRLPLL